MARARTSRLRDYFVPSRFATFTGLRPYDGEFERPRGVPYRLGWRLVSANSRAYDTVLGLPDRLEENWLILRDPKERRMMRRALFDDRLMTGDRRKALLSILLWTVVLAWAVTGIAISLWDRQWLPFYRSGYNLFFYSLATSVFLPTPFELLLSESVRTLGVFWTVTVAALAKTAGSWVVLLAGDKANEGLNQVLGRKGVMARIFRALERFAQRWGYGLVFVTLAIPFMADTAPLFVAAMLRMRKMLFLGVTLLAIVVRSLLFLYAPDLFGALL